MSLRKSPTLTTRFLAANRSNAAQSTGPRTRRGKAFSSLNRMKNGTRSRAYRRFFYWLIEFPSAIDRLADALLTPEQRSNQVFADLLATWPRFGRGSSGRKNGKN